MRMRKLPTVVLLLLLTATVSAANLQLHQEIAGLKEAGPPRLVGDTIIFSYSFDETAAGRQHLVEIAFEHEHFGRRHSFFVNDYGVYIYTMPVPRDREALRYRLIVDGLWTHDPQGLRSTPGARGTRVSVLDLPPAPPPTRGPVIESDGTVRFLYRGESGSAVSVVGDFNGWDPFLHQLVETSPGSYELALRLIPGTHRYYFVVDGVRLPDPLNPVEIVIRDRLFGSKFELP